MTTVILGLLYGAGAVWTIHRLVLPELPDTDDAVDAATAGFLCLAAALVWPLLWAMVGVGRLLHRRSA